MKEEGRGFYCIQFEGVLCLRADPRKLKREIVQNPTSAKIATLENSRYTVCKLNIMSLKKLWDVYYGIVKHI